MSEIQLLDYGDRSRWLASRTSAIGASEVAALFTDADGRSLSPFTTMHVLWLEKTGQLAPIELDGEWVEWGNLLEEPIAKKYAAITGRTVWQGGPYCVAQHPEIPFLRATPDRWVIEAPDRDGLGLVQIKNTNAFKAADWDDGPPEHVQIQTQSEMCVTGREWNSVAALIGGSAFRHWDVERNQVFIDEIEEQAKWFEDLVKTRRPPPIDGSARTLDALKRLHPNDNGETVRLPEESVAWVDVLEQAKTTAAIADLMETEAKAKLFAAIGPATFGELPDGRTVSLKTSSNPGREAATVAPYTYRTLRLVKAPTKGRKSK